MYMNGEIYNEVGLPNELVEKILREVERMNCNEKMVHMYLVHCDIKYIFRSCNCNACVHKENNWLKIKDKLRISNKIANNRKKLEQQYGPQKSNIKKIN